MTDRRVRGRRATEVLAGICAVLALVAGGCTGDGGGDELVVDDGGGDAAIDLALDNAYGGAARSIDGAPYDGVDLQVEYFEALRKGEWVAPEHCYFPTRVSVNGQYVSEGFDGPRSDQDRDAGDGALVGSLASWIPDGPGTTTDGTASDSGISTTTVVGMPGADGMAAREAVLVVVAVFGHDQVVELRTDHPAAFEGQSLEAQPLDGWNLLRVALDPGADLGESVPVTLRRVHADGRDTTEQIDVQLDRPGLELLTEAWRFDTGAVDGSCQVPDGTVDNRPAEPDTDLFGSPIGDAPDLPQPGDAPADPAEAADEALASLRAVYDLQDIYAESKRDHIENPEDWDVMRRKLMENDVVAPYMSNLDPEFRSSVFVSPTELHVLYKVGPSYQWEIGRVLLIDGRWRVAAGTVCRDLAAAGYSCPSVTNDPPPGPIG